MEGNIIQSDTLVRNEARLTESTYRSEATEVIAEYHSYQNNSLLICARPVL